MKTLLVLILMVSTPSLWGCSNARPVPIYGAYVMCSRPDPVHINPRPDGHIGSRDVADWLLDTISKMAVHIQLLGDTIECYELQAVEE